MAVETATPPQRALLRRRRLAGAAALAAAGLAVALAPAAASAQSLRGLYEAAHAYDATYLAARALADSATYRVEQTRALNRASASLSGNVAASHRPSSPATTRVGRHSAASARCSECEIGRAHV